MVDTILCVVWAALMGFAVGYNIAVIDCSWRRAAKDRP